MKYQLTLILLMTALSLSSQDDLLFNRLYEIQGDKIKIYIDGIYKVINKKCASYYMICKINDQLEFNVSVFIYDLNNRIKSKSYFQASKLQGKFISYYQNGEIETEGEYNQGIRKGEWTYYYKNGQIKKIIDFRDGEYPPLLESFYKKNGKQKVTNGNGRFKDIMNTSVKSSYLAIYKGGVKNGLLEGQWKVELNGMLINKEYFENGKLIEGISYSIILGNQEYHNNPISTIYSTNYLESVKIWGPSICINESMTMMLDKSFYDELYNLLFDYINEFNNSWYFIEFQNDEEGLYKDSYVFPRNDDLNKIIKDKFENKELSQFEFNISFESKIVIIVYFDDDVFLSNSDRTNNSILNRRY